MKPQVYTPGAGHRPAGGSLPGRNEVRAGWADLLDQADSVGRLRIADPVFSGLRGTGKTVLLSQLADDAELRGFATIRVQSTRTQGVWGEVMAAVERVQRARPEPFWRVGLQALRRIRGVQIAGVGIDVEGPEIAQESLGRSGGHLAETLAELGAAIRSAGGGKGGLVLTVDELQTAPGEDLELLGSALHQLNTAHSTAPVLFAGAGLPGLHETMAGPDPDRPVITHPERLFRFVEIPISLDEGAVAVALVDPVRAVGGSWDEAAIRRVAQLSNGYPAHLQVIAAHTWHQADTVHIGVEEVEQAIPAAAAEIEQQFLLPRWNRLTDRQQEYMTALAVAGGSATARQMAVILDRSGAKLSRVRAELLNRGEIHSPRSRVVALSMPLMGPYAVAVYPQAQEESAIHDRLLTLAQLKRNAATLPPLVTVPTGGGHLALGRDNG